MITQPNPSTDPMVIELERECSSLLSVTHMLRQAERIPSSERKDTFVKALSVFLQGTTKAKIEQFTLLEQELQNAQLNLVKTEESLSKKTKELDSVVDKHNVLVQSSTALTVKKKLKSLLFFLLGCGFMWWIMSNVSHVSPNL